jgi:YbbR domain-containing protein
MKKVLNFIWGLLKNNLLLKIMAVLFAVVLWSYVLAQTNPVREKSVDNVSVSYVNIADGLAISNTLSQIVSTVDVSFEVKQNDIKYVNSSSVKASVDLSNISEPGEYTFEIQAESQYGNAVIVSPKTVTLYIDQYVTHSLPVTAETSGSVPDGYYASDPVFEPDTVTVSGAASDVNLAERAICPIDLTGLTGWDKKSMEVTVLDGEDNALNSKLFSDGLPSVIVGMDILPVKTVPVDVASAIIGQDGLAPGYEIKDIECDPATVRIIGSAEALAGVTSIPLAPYSVSGASSDVVVPLAYQPPEGITVLDTEYAQVTVTIREKTASQIFKGVGIDV